MSMKKLDKIFNPLAIAVIGATNTEGKVGYSLMKNLISSGYMGTVYPVNPGKKSIQGVKAYASVKDIPDKIDLVIIATPAKTVLKIIEECGKQGVEGAVIISAGFKEAGKEGSELFNKLVRTAKKFDMRIIGPNCLGFIRPRLSLNASFANKMALPGRIAFISQSGALGTAILDWALGQNIGFSNFVSIGSMADIGFHDLIDYFGTDPGTQSILIYMESLTDAKRFLSAARAFARSKPIIILKAGKSNEGSKAARSHTGSLTGNDDVFDAAFKRAGVLRVDTIGELFDSAKTLAMQEIPRGKRLAIITNAGGPGVLATDYLIARGGSLAQLSKGTIKSLDKVLPKEWSRSDPVDVLGDADPERYRKAVELCLDDDNVDGVLVILTPQAVTRSSVIAKEICAIENKRKKTILASWMGEKDVTEGRDILEEGNIPVYSIPENAVRGFLNMYKYSRNIDILYETPASIPHAFTPKTGENKELIDKVVREGRLVLTEPEAKKILSNYDIPVLKSSAAKNAEGAAAGSRSIGFPVAMKVISPDILHKTDIGGVELNISSEEEAKNAFRKIARSVKENMPDVKTQGVLIEQMVSKKHELLIGCRKDPLFGPVIVFGMGGVAVEVFRDTNIGLPPLNMALAMRVIEDTKIYGLLKGYRGMKGVEISSIQFLLYKFAYLVMDFPEIKEMDINPFAVDDEGGIVLDAKVILDENIIGKKTEPYSHMVISPYPKEYITEFRMENGETALLRPVKPEDEPMEAEMFRNMSEETQRFRFFELIKDITHELLVRYTQIDYDREIAIIAEIDEKSKKKMAGVVRLISDPYNFKAEFAIVVADPWQHLGLGNKLTDHILEIAGKRKIKSIYADILPENNIMIDILKKRGFRFSDDNGMIHAELELRDVQ